MQNLKYEHLSLEELKEDLERCKEEHNKGNFMSDEIFDIEREIESRRKKKMKCETKDCNRKAKEDFVINSKTYCRDCYDYISTVRSEQK